MPRLNTLAINAQKKNTREGENLSAIVNRAKASVPIIKPNCTADVRCPNAELLRPKSDIMLFMTPLLANHKEVQQN